MLRAILSALHLVPAMLLVAVLALARRGRRLSGRDTLVSVTHTVTVHL